MGTIFFEMVFSFEIVEIGLCTKVGYWVMIEQVYYLKKAIWELKEDGCVG